MKTKSVYGMRWSSCGEVRPAHEVITNAIRLGAARSETEALQAMARVEIGTSWCGYTRIA